MNAAATSHSTGKTLLLASTALLPLSSTQSASPAYGAFCFHPSACDSAQPGRRALVPAQEPASTKSPPPRQVPPHGLHEHCHAYHAQEKRLELVARRVHPWLRWAGKVGAPFRLEETNTLSMQGLAGGKQRLPVCNAILSIVGVSDPIHRTRTCCRCRALQVGNSVYVLLLSIVGE